MHIVKQRMAYVKRLMEEGERRPELANANKEAAILALLQSAENLILELGYLPETNKLVAEAWTMADMEARS